MDYNKSTKLIPFILCIFLLSSCSPIISKQKIKLKDNVTVADKIYLSQEEVRFIINSLNKRRNELKNISSIVKTSLKSDKGSNTLKQVLIFENNSFLRIESLSVFGNPIMYLISEDNLIKVYYPSENIYLYGEDNVKNINKLIGINLESSEIMQIIAGNIDTAAYNENIYSGVKKDNYVYLTMVKAGAETLIVTDSNNFTIKKIVKYNNKKKRVLEIFYDKYEDVDGYLFPFKVTIDMLDTRRTINIKYKNISINKGLPQNIREIRLPKGVRKVNLDEDIS